MLVKFISIQARGGVSTGGERLLTGWMVFCLQVDGPITGVRGGELISGSLRY